MVCVSYMSVIVTFLYIDASARKLNDILKLVKINVIGEPIFHGPRMPPEKV